MNFHEICGRGRSWDGAQSAGYILKVIRIRTGSTYFSSRTLTAFYQNSPGGVTSSSRLALSQCCLVSWNEIFVIVLVIVNAATRDCVCCSWFTA